MEKDTAEGGPAVDIEGPFSLEQSGKSGTCTGTLKPAMVVSSTTGRISQQHTWSGQVFCSALVPVDATKAMASQTVLPISRMSETRIGFSGDKPESAPGHRRRWFLQYGL